MDREEALKKVRQMSLPKETMEILEALAPELAESEDEKIRKEIIDFIEWAEDRGMTRHDYHQAKRPAVWIAYLEKQKERGPLTKEEEYILHRIIEYLEDETCPSEWISLLHDIYCLPYEKQKEQKPILSDRDSTDFEIEVHEIISQAIKTACILAEQLGDDVIASTEKSDYKDLNIWQAESNELARLVLLYADKSSEEGATESIFGYLQSFKGAGIITEEKLKPFYLR